MRKVKYAVEKRGTEIGYVVGKERIGDEREKKHK